MPKTYPPKLAAGALKPPALLTKPAPKLSADEALVALEKTLTPMQKSVVKWLARTGRSPYAASTAGLCSEPAIVKWKASNIRGWVRTYIAAHPSAVRAIEDANKELIRLVPEAIELITATVKGKAGRRATPTSTRLAQWTIDEVAKLAKIELEKNVEADEEDGTTDNDELDNVLLMAKA
jgi:hypothetical protein